MLEDIKILGNKNTPEFVVCGFFTPNYRILAQSLSNDLTDQNPHHFFAKQRNGATWNDIVRMKPSVVLEASDLYPNSILILIDMDCSVRGSLRPLLNFQGDICASVKLRITNPPWPFRKKTVLHISSRLVVFKNNERVRKFLKEWDRELKSPNSYPPGCEMAMRVVLMRSYEIAFCPIDPKYAGLEMDKSSKDAIVIHRSESRKTGRK